MELPTLRADSFLLRPFRPDDAEAVHRISRDPEVGRWVGVPDPYLLEHARFFVDDVALRGARSGRRAELVVADAGSGAMLGRVGIGLGARDGEGEIGYWLAPEARGRGLATRAVRAMCTWAFDALALDVIFWRAEIGNDASRRVAERAGFEVEGTLRRGTVHRGERVDVWMGSLLPEELGRLELPADPPPAGEVPGEGIVLEVDPRLGDDELNELFAASWPDHEPAAFGPTLAWSLGWVAARQDGRLVGFVDVAWDGGGHGFVLSTTVHPGVRRQGLGQRLVRAATDLARDRGLEWLHVDFEEHLTSFYAGCGFRPTPAGLIKLR